MKKAVKIQELPRDNASRLAIYDAICEHAEETGTPGSLTTSSLSA